MKVSLQFIADKAHVSKSLVSKILNQREVRVSQDKREEILKLAKKYNYVPNKAASSLRTKKTFTIALLVPNITFDYFGKLSFAIEKMARSKGYNVIICNTSEDAEKEKHYLDMFRLGMVDGLLVCPTCDDASYESLKHIMYYQFPIVFIDRYIKGMPISSVVTNNLKGSFELTNMLLDKGHKKVSFIGRRKEPMTSDQDERYAGYKKAMEQKGLESSRYFLFKNDLETEEGMANLIKELPDAIVLSTSWDISKLLKVFKPYGIKIPSDVELAAYDQFYLPYGLQEDIDLAQLIERPLMIMEQQPYKIGELATMHLIDIIEGQKEKPQINYIEPIFNGRELDNE